MEQNDFGKNATIVDVLDTLKHNVHYLERVIQLNIKNSLTKTILNKTVIFVPFLVCT